jgi:DNA replication protein DnaC
LTHSVRCILRAPCRIADSDACNAQCASYIAMHGHNGNGGRNGAGSMPSEYRLITLANSHLSVIETTESKTGKKAELRGIIEKYVSTFPRMFSGERIRSLYLYSESPGTGKTTTACAVLNEYLIAHFIGSLKRNRQALQRPAYFLDINDWQSEYNAFNRPRVPESVAEPAAQRYYSAQSIAQSVPFLVCDDIGVRDASEAFRADLHAVINARVTAALPTVYTSNIPMTELSAIFDARLADRVRDQCVQIEFSGESRRGMRK